MFGRAFGRTTQCKEDKVMGVRVDWKGDDFGFLKHSKHGRDIMCQGKVCYQADSVMDNWMKGKFIAFGNGMWQVVDGTVELEQLQTRSATTPGYYAKTNETDEQFPYSDGVVWKVNGGKAGKIQMNAVQKPNGKRDDGAALFTDLKERNGMKPLPPNEKSLGAEAAKLEKNGGVQWVRAGEISPDDTPAKLFDNIEPGDVLQGSLGDCWLMAAIAGVAEFPRYIQERLFVESEVSANGMYHINLFDCGQMEWIVIEIDDFIPCKTRPWFSGSARPIFSQPSGNELWVLLLEKAFAKYAGGYDKLQGGRCALAWQNMTGGDAVELWEWSTPDSGDNAGVDAAKSVFSVTTRTADPTNFQTARCLPKGDVLPVKSGGKLRSGTEQIADVLTSVGANQSTPLLVLFALSYCAPCVDLASALIEKYNSGLKNKLSVVYCKTEPESETSQAFEKQMPQSWLQLPRDKSKRLQRPLKQNPSFPFFAILNPDGTVLAKESGFYSGGGVLRSWEEKSWLPDLQGGAALPQPLATPRSASSELDEKATAEKAPPHCPGAADMWEVLLHADKNNYMIGAGGVKQPKGTSAGESIDMMGLVSGHAFSVLACKELQDNNAEPLRLVQVRNPWGNGFEWSGDWGDDSSKWETIGPMEQHGIAPPGKGDGKFWMNFEDFTSNFQSVSICLHQMAIPDLDSSTSRVLKKGSHATNGLTEDDTTLVMSAVEKIRKALLAQSGSDGVTALGKSQIHGPRSLHPSPLPLPTCYFAQERNSFCLMSTVVVSSRGRNFKTHSRSARSSSRNKTWSGNCSPISIPTAVAASPLRSSWGSYASH
jgi:hypothetical protein